MSEVMLAKCIKIPAGEDLDKIIETFEHKLGFPQWEGAIDGLHIRIKAATTYHADYYNRKGIPLFCKGLLILHTNLLT